MSDTLVVVSKVKTYIKEKASMNCSATFIEALSDEVKRVCDRAIQEAESAKRKTVMDRDIKGE